MTSTLELHILERLDSISEGVTSLRTAFDLHVKAQAEYDAAKSFQATLRRSRVRWAVSIGVSLASFGLALWKFL
jgi:hypothetical protein